MSFHLLNAAILVWELNAISEKPRLANLYISLSKSFINISTPFFAFNIFPAKFLFALIDALSNLPPDNTWFPNISNPFLIAAELKPVTCSNFQNSNFGIPKLFITWSDALSRYLIALGIPYVLLPIFTSLTNALDTKSTPFPVPTNNFLPIYTPGLETGPTNFKLPNIAVPSAANFNLFLNTAAALSLPVKFSTSSVIVESNARSKKFPSASPKASPKVFCPILLTNISPAAAGNTQYPPNLAKSLTFLPVLVAANLVATFWVNFFSASLLITFSDIFLANPNAVPNWTNKAVNLAEAPSLSPYTSSKFILGIAFCTLANVSVSKAKSDKAAIDSANPPAVSIAPTTKPIGILV